MAKKKAKNNYKTEALAIALIAVAIFLAFIIYSQGDGGIIGGFLYRLLASLFGNYGSYIIVLSLILIGLTNLFSEEKLAKIKILYLSLIVISLLAFIHIYSAPVDDFSSAHTLGLEGLGSGVIGGYTVFILHKTIGVIGLYISLVTILLVGFLLYTGFSLLNGFKKIADFFSSIVSNMKKKQKSNKQKSSSKKVEAQKELPKEDKRQELIIESPTYNYNYEDDNKEQIEIDLDEKKEKNLEEESQDDINDDVKADADQDNIKAIVKDIREKKIQDQETESNSHFDESDLSVQVAIPDETYQLPNFNLLNNPEEKELDSQQFLRQQAYKIEETLKNFKIDARVTKVSVGPTITRFELQIAAGIKVSKVSSLENDIALSLAVKSIRIEAPIPGKSAIGIEVPNETNNIVLLKEVLTSDEFNKAKEGIKIGLGLDISGTPMISNINELPHLLIAGATGSGKSVCINIVISSILLTKKPHQVKFVLIDPKRVELSVYDELPHLLTPVVTDPKKAASALTWVVQEMEKRYQQLAKKGVRNILQYNKKITASQDEVEELPYVVVVIDELADLMMVASKDVEDAICRIAQMGRAAGIHLVVGTQRPSVDVITGLIKANIPARIAFAVSSSVDSRTILDMSGAEKLLGNGDMLYMPPGLNKPVRVQGSFISETEVNKIVDFIREQKEANYAKENFNKNNTGESSVLDEKDELFEEALLVFIEYGSASISLLQRRFRIGYTRAARIVDQLEEAGAITGYAGSKPRDVIMESEIVKELLERSN
jgi:S-DNA-T family DNA segregation ATPase FtsK/SpoIIIE